MSKMSKVTTTSVSIRLVKSFIIVTLTLLLLSWTAVAYAQQTSSDVQYGSPTAGGEAAIEGSGLSGTAGSTGGTDPAGSTGVVGVLPATGGPLLQLAALGALALASTGLLVLRHHSRR